MRQLPFRSSFAPEPAIQIDPNRAPKLPMGYRHGARSCFDLLSRRRPQCGSAIAIYNMPDAAAAYNLIL